MSAQIKRVVQLADYVTTLVRQILTIYLSLLQVGSFICECKSGYTKRDGSCHDIDECYDNSHNCTVNALCENLGKYKKRYTVK